MHFEVEGSDYGEESLVDVRLALAKGGCIYELTLMIWS
jgi:hypothetical protein